MKLTDAETDAVRECARRLADERVQDNRRVRYRLYLEGFFADALLIGFGIAAEPMSFRDWRADQQLTAAAERGQDR